MCSFCKGSLLLPTELQTILSLVVVIITLILLIIISPIASRTDPIFATSLEKDVIMKGEMDEAHKFSLRYNSSVIETKPQLRWNMSVWIEAEPEVLQLIKHVSAILGI
jgi:hypothetical protein